jgi:hypothetical protein
VSYLFAAWVALDSFNCGTIGGDLDGDACGLGWSAGWVDGGGGQTITVEIAPVGMSGLAACSSETTSEADYSRALTAAVSAGTFSIRMILDDNSNTDDFLVILRDETNPIVYVRFSGSGNIDHFVGGGTSDWVNYGTYSANTVYTIYIDWDDGAQDNKYRFKVDEGSYTIFYDAFAAYTAVTAVRLNDNISTTHTGCWDSIGGPETRSITIFGEPQRVIH